MMQTSASPVKQATVNARFLNVGGSASNCKRCDKRVYEMEKMVADTAIYHKACFRCTHCNGVLSLKNYTANGVSKLPYCKTHFIQLFREKGNYDEGFGMVRNAKAVGKDDMVDSPKTNDQSPAIKNNYKFDKQPVTASPLAVNRFMLDEPTDVRSSGVEQSRGGEGQKEESDRPEEGSMRSLIASFQNRQQVSVESAAQKKPAKQQVKLIENDQQTAGVVVKPVTTPVHHPAHPQLPEATDAEDEGDDFMEREEIMNLRNSSNRANNDHHGDVAIERHHVENGQEEYVGETDENSSPYHHDIHDRAAVGYRAGDGHEDYNDDENEQQAEKKLEKEEDESYESHGQNGGHEDHNRSRGEYHGEFREEYAEESDEGECL